MNELKPINNLKVEYILPTLTYDISDIKNGVNELSEQIKALLDSATENDFEIIKERKTEMNKLAKALSDKRIEIVKEIKKPLDSFETEVKNVTKQVQDLSDKLNNIVIEHENALKEKKKAEILALPDYANYSVFNEKWLLKGTTIAQVEFELAEQKKVFQGNAKLIETTCKAYGLDSDKYYLMLVDGKNADEIVAMIENDVEVKNSYSKPSETEPIIPKEILRSTEIYRKTFTIKATEAQLTMVKAYLDKIGVEIIKE